MNTNEIYLTWHSEMCHGVLFFEYPNLFLKKPDLIYHKDNIVKFTFNNKLLHHYTYDLFFIEAKIGYVYVKLYCKELKEYQISKNYIDCDNPSSNQGVLYAENLMIREDFIYLNWNEYISEDDKLLYLDSPKLFLKPPNLYDKNTFVKFTFNKILLSQYTYYLYFTEAKINHFYIKLYCKELNEYSISKDCYNYNNPYTKTGFLYEEPELYEEL